MKRRFTKDYGQGRCYTDLTQFNDFLLLARKVNLLALLRDAPSAESQQQRLFNSSLKRV
ncbi:MAG: hypothetical protein AAF959_16970 [Cyanobacteria bacterium P01_D01_bin.56]